MYYETYKASLGQTKTYHLVLTNNADQLRDALDRNLGDYVLENRALSSLFSRDLNREQFPQMWRLRQWTSSDAFQVLREFPTTDGRTGPHLVLYRRVPGSAGPR